MGACDGRTQGASIAALSRRPRTPQRACPARSGSPCSFCWSFLAHLDLGRHAHATECAEVALMRAKRGEERRLRRIANAVLGSVALHDLGDPRIVGVRHARKEMVLDLVVDPAEHPREEGVARAEV